MSLYEVFSGNDKSCLYCKSASTPAWRMGPDGSKSLCNACGIRWRRTSKDKSKTTKKNLESTQLMGIVRVCSPDEIELVARTPEDMSPDLSPVSSIFNKSEENERFLWDEISEVAKELTKLSEGSRKRKHSSKSTTNKRNKQENVALEMISQKLDDIRHQQETNDQELDMLHAKLLRQNNERIAVTTMAAELHRQVETLQQALMERDRMIEELKISFRTKVILQKVKTGSWEM